MSDAASDDNLGKYPWWLTVVIIVVALWCFIGGCVCFVRRCFAPAGQQGPIDCVSPAGSVMLRNPSGKLSEVQRDEYQVGGGNRGAPIDGPRAYQNPPAYPAPPKKQPPV
jgi:hypothetical protein